MKNAQSYLQRIEWLKDNVKELAGQKFTANTEGTHHKVYVSENYVIRFRDDQPKTLVNESILLKKLDHNLIPKIVWTGESMGFTAMVQNKLPGKSLNRVWPKATIGHQEQIIADLIEFIKQLRSIVSENSMFYSVKSGKFFRRYIDLLQDGLKQDVAAINNEQQAHTLLEKLLKVLKNPDLHSALKINRAQLVHGDLILHNLLSDGEHLTGVLDWELSFYGDEDYDLARLMYYQECARAYPEGKKNCEPDFLKKFFRTAIGSNLISDVDNLNQKYKYYRTLFILRALKWAVQSKDPKNNIKELEDLYKNRKCCKELLTCHDW